jgi:hypothetical protein
MHLPIAFRMLKVENLSNLRRGGCFCRRGGRSLLSVFPVEPFHPTSGVNQLLLPGKEGMAG